LLSFFAGAATCFGSGLVMLFGRPTEESLSVFLGLAVGIMSGVVVLDLIPSSYEYGSLLTTLTGLVLGTVVLYILDNALGFVMSMTATPHRYSYLLRTGLLIGIGIALHDLPEGIAIAAGHSAAERLGLIITLAIALHNIPEGMATTAPLWMGGMRRRRIGIIIILVSLVTPLGALLGVWLVHISKDLISVLLAFAGGAMIYIVTMELIPEAVRCSLLRSVVGAVLGFSVIILLSGI